MLMATKQLAKPDGSKWTQSQLTQLKRDDLEDILKKLGVSKPHTIRNKDACIFKILELQGQTVDDPDDLNANQRLFCELFTSDMEFFGSGVDSYVEAYSVSLGNPGAYASAKAAASRLLNKPNVIKHINQLLEKHALNDENVDKQLAFLINQQSDFKSKLGAIKEYNTMKERVQRNAPTINMNFYSFTDERAKKIVKAHEDWVLENTKAINAEAA